MIHATIYKKLTLLSLILLGSWSPLLAQKTSVYDAFVKDMEYNKGYFSFYYDAASDELFLEVDKLESEFLYVNSLATGVGSNDIGLDRGQLGRERVVKFVKVGAKLLLVQPNLDFRAVSDNFYEQESVEQAFAQSVLWGFKIVKQEKGKYLVNATDFLLRDAHNVSGTLKRDKQGSYSVDKSRSALYIKRTKAFPKNTEFEATLTFTGTPEGYDIRSVTPTPTAVTVRQHHSFIELPDNKYKPRVFDPRAGYFEISYQDYATPIDQPLVKRFITRHRLEKKEPNAATSEPVEPIVYYLDRGAPEPVRSALMEGASWWNQAFEAAGYKNAFRVELLPEDADPMDVRYNLIQWVHRSTRGWSYGSSVIDPRTGEIIKGHVSLGSLRVRQDFLIATGLLSPYDGKGTSEEAKQMALARLRQLAAHEVGHTLGLAHNYSASMDGRASVMDYPHPLVDIKNGELSLANAYDTGIGEWDKVSITYGYQDFPKSTDEEKALNAILFDAYQNQHLSFLSDQDARPQSSASPRAHLWDNGSNAAKELEHVLEVRKIALNQFGENSIPDGSPVNEIEDVLAPIYFFHRYQTEAVVKVIGGLNYTYAVKGDGQVPTTLVDPALQKEALTAVLKTLDASVLTLPEPLLKELPPRPLGYYRTRENIKSKTGLTFDPISAAESSAEMTLSLLLNPARANRLVEHNARNNAQPGLDYVIDQLLQSTLWAANTRGLEREVQRAVNAVVLDQLMQLAVSTNAFSQTKAIVWNKLKEVRAKLGTGAVSFKGENEIASMSYTIDKLDKFFEDPDEWKHEETLSLPDGSPIGSLQFNCVLDD
ncbi:MAG: zinc-dependent metalloprotease [Cyclobacteriaceae bacterium]|nr:zinc-dependent metalloprotease [Cyclobacteriaceae bacterium]